MHLGMGKKWLMDLMLLISLYIYQLISKVQLPGSIRFDSQIKIHTGTEKKYVSLAREFKNNLEVEQRKNGVIDHGKSRKIFMNRNGQKGSIIFRIMRMLNSKM